MKDILATPINLYCLTVLTHVQKTPGITKSNLYSTPNEKEVVDMLLNKDLLRMEHYTARSTGVFITHEGTEMINALWGIIDLADISHESVTEIIEEKIEYNNNRFDRKFDAAKRTVSIKRGRVPSTKRNDRRRRRPTPPDFSTKGLNMKDLILRNGEYIRKDEL